MRKDDAKPWVRAIGRRWRGRDEFRRRVEFAGDEQREEKEEERRLLRVLKDEDDVTALAASSRARPHPRPRVHARETARRRWTAASRQLRGTADSATVHRLNLHLLLLRSLDSVEKLDQLH